MGAPGPTVRSEEVPDVVAPPPHHPRYPLTVGLRGVAAIAIIVGHAWFFTGGFGGFTASLPNRIVVRWDGVVAVFFMLSAFLLYRPMIAHRVGGPAAPRVGDYARRRFLRLYPAYWVALTALAIFPGLFGVFSHNWWAFYSLVDFLELDLHSVCPPTEEFSCGLPQSWTLGIDLTFYVVLPFYAGLTALVARRLKPHTWMRWELALLVVLAGASLLLGSWPLDLRDQAWFRYSFAGYFYWFALGLGLAVISVVYSRAESPPRAIRLIAAKPALCWAGGFAIYVLTVLLFSDVPFVFGFNNDAEYVWLTLIQGVGATLFFLPAVFANPNRGLPARILGHPFLMWTGLISYGLLLWHGTVAVMLGSLFGSGEGFWTVLIAEIVIAVPLAMLSYHFVERPLMRFKYRPLREVLQGRSRRSSATAADAKESG